jgi:hypothetical protein
MNFSHKLKLSQHCKVLDIWVRGGGGTAGFNFILFEFQKERIQTENESC